MCKGVHASEKKKKSEGKSSEKDRRSKEKKRKNFRNKTFSHPFHGSGGLQNMSSSFVYASVTWQDLPLVPAL